MWGAERKKSEEKWTEPEGHHQASQHLHYWSFTMAWERKKGGEKVFEEIMAQNFPNMM